MKGITRGILSHIRPARKRKWPLAAAGGNGERTFGPGQGRPPDEGLPAVGWGALAVLAQVSLLWLTARVCLSPSQTLPRTEQPLVISLAQPAPAPVAMRTVAPSLPTEPERSQTTPTTRAKTHPASMEGAPAVGKPYSAKPMQTLAPLPRLVSEPLKPRVRPVSLPANRFQPNEKPLSRNIPVTATAPVAILPALVRSGSPAMLSPAPPAADLVNDPTGTKPPLGPGTTTPSGAGAARPLSFAETDSHTYLALVQQVLIQAKRYPAAARRRGIEGFVQLSFAIDRNGQATAIDIEGPTHPILAAAARALVADRRLPVPPSGWNTTTRVVVPLTYRLK
jgi:periplasmic protein TonB